jgi:hypothetical protein
MRTAWLAAPQHEIEEVQRENAKLKDKCAVATKKADSLAASDHDARQRSAIPAVCAHDGTVGVHE